MVKNLQKLFMLDLDDDGVGINRPVSEAPRIGIALNRNRLESESPRIGITHSGNKPLSLQVEHATIASAVQHYVSLVSSHAQIEERLSR